MKVIVVGAGIIGLSSAYWLDKAGAQVVVIDQEAGPGKITSFANGGLLTPSMATPWNVPGLAMQILKWMGNEEAPLLLRPKALPKLWRWGLRFLRESRTDRYWANTEKNARLALDTIEKLRSMREDAQLEFTHTANGTLEVHRDSRRLAQAAKKAERLRPLGIQSRVLDRAALLWNEPALEPVERELAGAICFPGDESGNAHQFCEALEKHLQTTGVEFHFNQSVLSVMTKTGKALGVETAQAEFQADAVVLAAGTATTALAKVTSDWIPVAPVKGYSITVDAKAWKQRPRLPVADDDLHATATPLGTDIRVAGTAELAGADTSLTPSRVSNVLNLLKRMYPNEAGQLTPDEVSPWTGLRPMSADGVPLVGPTSMPGLFVNSGHGHLGWTLGAGSGHLLAQLITNGESAVSPLDYSATRFGR